MQPVCKYMQLTGLLLSGRQAREILTSHKSDRAAESEWSEKPDTTRLHIHVLKEPSADLFGFGEMAPPSRKTSPEKLREREQGKLS